MKVFNGNKFLDAHQVNLELSNGYKTVVREIPPGAMEAIGKPNEDDAKLEQTLKSQLALLCETVPESFEGVGIVEMRGAIDFLLESLFTTK